MAKFFIAKQYGKKIRTRDNSKKTIKSDGKMDRRKGQLWLSAKR